MHGQAILIVFDDWLGLRRQFVEFLLSHIRKKPGQKCPVPDSQPVVGVGDLPGIQLQAKGFIIKIVGQSD